MLTEQQVKLHLFHVLYIGLTFDFLLLIQCMAFVQVTTLFTYIQIVNTV